MQTVVVGGQNPVAGMSNADTGLWIGTATLSAVSEPHSAAPTVLTPTPSEFTMRLILHVDGNGTARLLKEAIILQRASTGTPPTAGEFVVISDPALIGSFKTPDNHDGARFAPRVSSVAYDFNGVHVPLSGNFGGSLTGNIVMPRNHPTNPFKHRYHPDHDDLTAPPSYGTPPANLPAEQQEVWEVARALNMTFAAPVANNSPDAANTRTGTYTETITGLHNKALVTSGTFLLKKINTIAKLNPAP
jgi:hypothetical protein